MSIQQKTNSPRNQIKKQFRRSYTTEQNEFILDCFKIVNIGNKKQQWIEIAKLFKNRFRFVQPERTPKDLLDHFEHSLDKSLKRGPFTIEEHNFILSYVSEKGNQWKVIGQILNRNENQIKNEFYRKISAAATITTRKEETIEREAIMQQFESIDFKDEFDFESSLIDIFSF
jgi:hypothetical protein